ncbi:hypothetical protein, partial [Pseudoalteromonas piscicida]|uniref:hypothetical protein n=1 Tax=Pseudoalteromonas piscicida TaxID=43662 RepID=UPI003C7BD09F
VKINKIIIATESQLTWTPRKKYGFSAQQINELKQYLPTPQQSIELLHSVALAASKIGIDVEHMIIDDIDNAINKIRLSASKKTCVWVVSDGRVFHNSSPICAWLKNVNIQVFGIDTTIQSLTDNKYLMTVIAERHGLLIPESRLYQGTRKLAEIAGFNSQKGFFVKPNTLGSQIGISSNSRVSSLSQAVEISENLYQKYGVDSLIQSYIDGVDYRVSVIERKKGDIEFNCSKISISNNLNQKQEFSTNRTESGRKWHLEAVTSFNSPVYKESKKVVNQLYNIGLINCYAGIDLRGTDKGGYFFLENNVKPFISNSFSILAKELSYSSLGEMFIDSIINRCKDQNQLSHRYFHE